MAIGLLLHLKCVTHLNSMLRVHEAKISNIWSLNYSKGQRAKVLARLTKCTVSGYIEDYLIIGRAFLLIFGHVM